MQIPKMQSKILYLLGPWAGRGFQLIQAVYSAQINLKNLADFLVCVSLVSTEVQVDTTEVLNTFSESEW